MYSVSAAQFKQEGGSSDAYEGCYLVEDILVETEWDVSLQGLGHALEEWAEADSLVPLPDVLVVAIVGRK